MLHFPSQMIPTYCVKLHSMFELYCGTMTGSVLSSLQFSFSPIFYIFASCLVVFVTLRCRNLAFFMFVGYVDTLMIQYLEQLGLRRLRTRSTSGSTIQHVLSTPCRLFLNWYK